MADASGQPRRRALLLDLGGVLVGVDPARTFRALQDHAAAAPGVLAACEALAGRLKERAFDLGEMSSEEFRVAVCAALSIELDQPLFERLWSAMITALEQPPALLAELAARHATYLLSNTDPIHFAAAAHLAPGWLASLDGLHLSYEVGLAKPAPEYFKAALEAFGLEPERCLLLDDRRENLDGAAAVGIAGRLVGPEGLTRASLVEWGLLASSR